VKNEEDHLEQGREHPSYAIEIWRHVASWERHTQG
jgi:hypothetical protein